MRWPLIAAGVAALGTVVLAMGPGAVWVLHHVYGVHGITGTEKAAALDAIQGRILAIVTGIVGIVVVFYTARNTQVARRAQQHSEDVARKAQEATRLSHDLAVRTAERTAELAEQGQVTERYTKAIEQLGSDNLHIRIGGIYALERIARDSARDHPTVIDVLAAFVRERSHDTDSHGPAAPEGTEEQLALNDVGRLRPDLHAAVTVIGRRDTNRDADSVDLSRAYLQNTVFSGVNLSGVNLTSANLSGVNLTGANMTIANLFDANLNGANLNGANLTSADLTSATLTSADLIGANLAGADLSHAKLSGADLTGADLSHADLTGADLTRADLTSATMIRAELFYTDLTGADLDGADLTDVVHADISKTRGTPRGGGI